MGCDIHAFAEVRDRSTAPWRLITEGFVSGYYHPDKTEKDSYFDQDEFKNGIHPIDIRNYDAFAILANVRNGCGFAGVVTAETCFPHISDNRGFPDDASDELSRRSDEDYDDLWLGDHSFTWVTLAELEVFPWMDTITKCGYVNVEDRKKMLANPLGMPDNWSGDVYGGRVVKVSVEELDELIAHPEFMVSGKSYYTLVSWEVSYAYTAGQLYESTIPALRKLVTGNMTPDDVRIVMGFDS